MKDTENVENKTTTQKKKHRHATQPEKTRGKKMNTINIRTASNTNEQHNTPKQETVNKTENVKNENNRKKHITQHSELTQHDKATPATQDIDT